MLCDCNSLSLPLFLSVWLKNWWMRLWLMWQQNSRMFVRSMRKLFSLQNSSSLSSPLIHQRHSSLKLKPKTNLQPVQLYTVLTVHVWQCGLYLCVLDILLVFCTFISEVDFFMFKIRVFKIIENNPMISLSLFLYICFECVWADAVQRAGNQRDISVP